MKSLVPYGELRAFARVATRLLSEHLLREGGARSVRSRAGAGLEFLEHRHYQPGDELRHIDWRQSARQQQTIVRRYQLESSIDWYLCLDASSSMSLTRADGWRLAAQCAAALAYVLLEMGHRVALLQFAQQVVAVCPPGRGLKQYLHLNQQLQRHWPRARAAGSHLGSCLARVRAGSAAFVVSDFLTNDNMQRDLAALRSVCRQVHALQLADPERGHLHAHGHVTLHDCETGERQDALAESALDHAAATSLLRRQNALRDFGRSCGVHVSCWQGVNDWRGALLGHLNSALPRA